jgi:ArsR family transcriptional regulator
MIAGELQTFKAQFFRALAHPTRIRMLEILVRGERTVQELQTALALDQPLVSQQLAVLRNQGIVSARKEGLAVRYMVRDPLIGDLLDVNWRRESVGADSGRIDEAHPVAIYKPDFPVGRLADRGPERCPRRPGGASEHAPSISAWPAVPGFVSA